MRPFHMQTSFRNTLLALGLIFLAGCAQYDNNRGVEVTWDDSVINQIKTGETTRKDVLKLLGPPSQVIAMEDESVLYYLYARSQGEGLILIIYNKMQVDTHYDRAVFFFDDNDVLTEYATHIADDPS